jgi:allophanate hydrolase
MERGSNFDLSTLRDGYRNGRFTPADVVREAYRRIRERGASPVWIHLIPEEDLVRRAEALGPFREDLPLYGVPFAIKDNIDLAGVPTTAGCPDFAYTPVASSTVVARLVAAGAIPVGKTNLDQFATGLVGTRSPYGACSSVFDEAYIAGGSSSGSAVAVAAGLVSFSLGTDTAGSGRVPAAFNNIVGLKATRGAVSTAGVVPACRTLDCVSVFAQTCADAATVLEAASAWDQADPYSRATGQRKAWPMQGFRFGVPADDCLRFFGDDQAASAYYAAVRQMEEMGGICVAFDYGIFTRVAQLLYSGPWVAERYAAIRAFLAEHPDSLHPVTARIIGGAKAISAADTFDAMYRLAELARAAETEWRQMDFMLLPTAGTHYTHAEVAAEPIAANANLGYYTNFVNLLDLAAVAVPAGTRGGGMPSGVTLIGPAWSDAALLETADAFHRSGLSAVTGANLSPLDALPAISRSWCPAGYVPLAVCGAHLTGQPLNWQLTSAGAFLIEAGHTSPEYKLYALRGTTPAKPGLVYVGSGGAAIEVEVWAVPENAFGGFVTAIPPPLGIGSCILATGRRVKSFICEPFALNGAMDITAFGGWRAYLAAGSGPGAGL